MKATQGIYISKSGLRIDDDADSQRSERRMLCDRVNLGAYVRVHEQDNSQSCGRDGYLFGYGITDGTIHSYP